MPKSKEFIDNSDSASDEESGATATSKKPVAKGLNDKNDVSNFKEKKSVVFLFNRFFICISLQLNELKQMIKRMMMWHRRLDLMVNDSMK
jgi:hypothetical protein